MAKKQPKRQDQRSILELVLGIPIASTPGLLDHARSTTPTARSQMSQRMVGQLAISNHIG